MSVRQRKPTNGEPAAKPSTTVSRIYAPTEHGRLIDAKLDSHTSWEFGGPWGVTAMMLGFPALMYYLWICLWFYHGQFARPSVLAWEGKGGVADFLGTMWGYVKNVSFDGIVMCDCRLWDSGRIPNVVRFQDLRRTHRRSAPVGMGHAWC